MLEMNLVEYRAFKVAKKLRLKKKLENQAALVITKAARIWKKVKEKSDIPSYKVTELTNQVEDFQRVKNGYQNEKEEGLGQIQEVFREFEILKNTNKEMKINLGVLANMVNQIREDYKSSNEGQEDSYTHKGRLDRDLEKIQQILLSSINQPDILFEKNQLILRDLVSYHSGGI